MGEVPRDCPALVVEEMDVCKQVRRFKTGSAGGRDGLLPQHLKDMLAVRIPSIEGSLSETLTSFVKLALRGGLPASFAPFFTSAPVTPGIKKNGGLRPISVGENLRLLLSKVAM